MSKDGTAWRITAKMQGEANVCRVLKQYPEKIGRTLLSLIKQEARGMGVELARFTRPPGFGDKWKKAGEKAVAGDIAKVYATPSDAYKEIQKVDQKMADKFWGNVTNNRFTRAATILQKSGSAWADLPMGRLNPAIHKANRNDRGQVKIKKPAQVVTGDKPRDRYIAKKQRMVGYAKAAWINAAKAIGGRVRGAAQWVTRHKTSPGTAIVREGDKPSVTLTNHLDYAEAATTAETVSLALENAQARLRKALATSLRKVNEKTNQHLNRKAS